jgi:hypothetical protein
MTKGNLKDLVELHDQLRATVKSCTSERDELRSSEDALDSPEAVKALQPAHRTGRKIEQRRATRKRVEGTEAVLAQARAALEMRESLIGVEAVLRGARFAVPVPPRDWSGVLEHYKPGGAGYDERREQDRESQRLMVNELRAVREETTRTRWRAELPLYSVDELASLVRQCQASNDLALLATIRREVAGRARTNPSENLAPVRSALVSALQTIAPPPDVKELADVLDQIGDLSHQLESAYGEIVSGRRDDISEKVEGIRAATAEHGPIDGPQKWVERRIREREARKGQVAAVAKDEARAIEEPKPAA